MSTSYSLIAFARVLGVLVSSMLITPIPQHTNAVAARAPAKPITPPVQLRALAFTAREVELSWRAAPDAATRYEVKRDGQVLGEFPASTGAYVDRLALPDTRHRYSITAYAVDGNTAISTIDALTPALPRRIDLKPPASPQWLSASTPAGAITLAWSGSDDNNSISAYEIQRDGTRIARVDGNAREWRDSSARPGMAHAYSVEAIDPSGNHSVRKSVGPVQTREP